MKNQKIRAGRFVVFHCGKMLYTVEADGVELGRFRNLSTAYAFACRRYEAERIAIRSEA